MNYKAKISEKLTKLYNPNILRVIDESENHRGHSGFKEGQQTHFQIQIKSNAFDDMSRLKREREIHKALGEEIIKNIHAISIKFL